VSDTAAARRGSDQLTTLRGALDGVCHSGYVQGWAYDTRSPLRPLCVMVLDQRRREVARGLAGGYRKDLAYEGHAAGWCALRLRLHEEPGKLAWQRLTLVRAPSRERIFRSESIPYLVTDTIQEAGLAGLVAADPTLIQSLDQLRACEALFDEYIEARGAEAFVRAAYRYLLSRPVDANGLTSSMKHLRARMLSPFGLMQTIADSEEYRSRPRPHCAPIMAAFPFRVA
jgi:hypothetical protein